MRHTPLFPVGKTILFPPVMLLCLLNCSQRKQPPELFKAVEEGDVKKAHSLLFQKADLHEKDMDGNQVLHCAVKRNDSRMVQVLLAHSARVNATDRLARTPLWLASERGCEQIVEKLLHYGAGVNQKSCTGKSALHMAAKAGKLSIVTLLVDAGAYVETIDNQGFTPLHRAVEANNLENMPIITYLLDQKADIEAETKGRTKPIHLANNPSILDLLLEKGANPNDLNGKGEPILHTYVEQGNVALVNVLLAHKAPLSLKDADGETVLHKAARKVFNQDDLLHILLAYNSDYANAKNKWGQTPLHVAAYNGNLAMTRLLISINADVNAKDHVGWTPLHKALHCRKGLYNGQDPKLEQIRLLLEQGAHLNEQDNFGRTPLHHAIDYVPNDDQGFKVIRLLLDQGASTMLEDYDGRSVAQLLNNKLRMVQ